MPVTYITCEMYASDFADLAVDTCAWQPTGRAGEFDPFQPIYPERPEPGLISRWKMAYSMERNRLHMEAARGYLAAVGEPYQVVWYRGLRQFHGFLVLTDLQVRVGATTDVLMPGHRRRSPLPQRRKP